MRRREFITLLGGTAAWPLAARGQQSAMPVVGYFGISSPEVFASRLQAFRQALAETGLHEGRNVTIDYHWAHSRFDRLPSLASGLVGRRPTVIVAAGSTAAALAVKTATTTIPIVFEIGGDPLADGVVSSLSRPGGNITGVTSLNVEVNPKRLELLHELIPNVKTVGLLVNPADRIVTEPLLPQMRAAARMCSASSFTSFRSVRKPISNQHSRGSLSLAREDSLSLLGHSSSAKVRDWQRSRFAMAFPPPSIHGNLPMPAAWQVTEGI